MALTKVTSGGISDIAAAVEGASDSNKFTDADHSKLNAIEASADVTDATNVTAAGALMDSEVTNLSEVKAFDASDYATAAQGTLATNALPKAGGTMTGDLTIYDATGDPFIKLQTDEIQYVLRVDNSASDIFQLRDSTNSANRIGVSTGGDISFYEDTGTTAKLFWDASAEALGIGTSSPAHNVEIVATASGSVNDTLQIRNNATATGTGSRIRFINSTDKNSDTNGASIASIRTGNDNDLAFETENTERMRIDSSGNVGIGTSSPLKPLHTKGSASAPCRFERLTDDGQIIQLYKDGSTVGSIGTHTGYTRIGSTGNGGLIFRNGNISPWNNGSSTYSDNAINLGVDTARFKDLYLSGGVYLGGTGSANKLDDYEEGTWTPAATLTHNPNSRTVSTISSSGYYTKIGRFVTVFGKLQYNIAASPSGSFNMGCSGFPFSTSVSVTGGGTARDGTIGATYILQSFNGTTVGVFRKYNNSSTPDTTNTTLDFSFTYQTI